VYETVLANERSGKFLGKTVQVIPHVTDEIKRRIRQLADETAGAPPRPDAAQPPERTRPPRLTEPWFC